MKTNREWLMMMDEPERSQAIENGDNDIPNTMNAKQYSLFRAIGGSFIWMNTPQGRDYWSSIAEKYRNR